MITELLWEGLLLLFALLLLAGLAIFLTRTLAPLALSVTRLVISLARRLALRLAVQLRLLVDLRPPLIAFTLLEGDFGRGFRTFDDPPAPLEEALKIRVSGLVVDRRLRPDESQEVRQVAVMSRLAPLRGDLRVDLGEFVGCPVEDFLELRCDETVLDEPVQHDRTQVPFILTEVIADLEPELGIGHLNREVYQTVTTAVPILRSDTFTGLLERSPLGLEITSPGTLLGDFRRGEFQEPPQDTRTDVLLFTSTKEVADAPPQDNVLTSSGNVHETMEPAIFILDGRTMSDLLPGRLDHLLPSFLGSLRFLLSLLRGRPLCMLLRGFVLRGLLVVVLILELRRETGVALENENIVAKPKRSHAHIREYDRDGVFRRHPPEMLLRANLPRLRVHAAGVDHDRIAVAHDRALSFRPGERLVAGDDLHQHGVAVGVIEDIKKIRHRPPTRKDRFLGRSGQDDFLAVVVLVEHRWVLKIDAYPRLVTAVLRRSEQDDRIKTPLPDNDPLVETIDICREAADRGAEGTHRLALLVAALGERKDSGRTSDNVVLACGNCGHGYSFLIKGPFEGRTNASH